MSDRHPIAKVFGGGIVGTYYAALVAFKPESDFSTEVAIVFTLLFTVIGILVAVALLLRDRAEMELAHDHPVNAFLKQYFCNGRALVAIGGLTAFLVAPCIVYLFY